MPRQNPGGMRFSCNLLLDAFVVVVFSHVHSVAEMGPQVAHTVT